MGHPIHRNDGQLTNWMKAQIRNALRQGRDAPSMRVAAIDRTVNERAAVLARMQRAEENGKIAVVRSGMDCDCSQYYRVCHIDMPKSVVEWLVDEDKHREWLDGPESVYFGKPSEYPEERLSSDRALEAYEEGHPSYVTRASLDEMRAY